jgi:hypothetical protein
MRVFIEKRNDGEFFDINSFAAFEGFSQLDYEIIPFRFGDSLADLTNNDIVCGCIRTVRFYLRQLGIKLPAILDYPDELKHYLKRDIIETTIGSLNIPEGNVIDPPIFIKPSRIQKGFNGLVLSSFKDLLKIAHLPDDTHIYKSTHVDFKSEYRVFVNQGKVIGCKHYTGDWKLMPDPTVVESMIKFYTQSPIAYSLDVGIANGETLLIEVNDFFSLGCYGLDPFLYVEAIQDRWQEIIKEGTLCGAR